MPAKASPTDFWTLVLSLFGLGNLANGAWMLLDPPHWYATLPAGVPDFGPLNEHFIRDIARVTTQLLVVKPLMEGLFGASAGGKGGGFLGAACDGARDRHRARSRRA